MQIEVGVLFICVGLMILFERVHYKVITPGKTGRLAERVTLVGTLVVYLAFIGGLYINDLWGFAMWLKANLSEAFALSVFVVLGVTLPLTVAYIKSVVYRYLER